MKFKIKSQYLSGRFISQPANRFKPLYNLEKYISIRITKVRIVNAYLAEMGHVQSLKQYK